MPVTIAKSIWAHAEEIENKTKQTIKKKKKGVERYLNIRHHGYDPELGPELGPEPDPAQQVGTKEQTALEVESD